MTRNSRPAAGGPAAFGLPPEVVWLDTAHQGPMPRVALEAGERALSWKRDPSRIRDRDFFDAPERLRSALASLLGRPPEEIVLGDSASHGLHVLAAGLSLGAGEEVLLVRDDFPATLFPWLPLRDRGVRLRFLPRRAGLTPKGVAAAIGPRTRLLCVTWVDSFSGHVLDVERVGRICRERGVVFVLNATQGLGVRPLLPGRVAVDAVTSAGYKWLCGPYGTGVCWIAGDILDGLRSERSYWLPPVRERGLESPGDLLDAPPPDGARRHDVFGTARFLDVLPWTAAVEYLLDVGVGAAADHNRELVTGLRRSAEAHGCAVADGGGGDSPFVVFAPPPGVQVARVASALEADHVHLSLRNGRLRASPHLHNEPADIERFHEALGRALGEVG